MSTGLEGFADWQRYENIDGPVIIDVLGQNIPIGGTTFPLAYIGNFEYISGRLFGFVTQLTFSVTFYSDAAGTRRFGGYDFTLDPGGGGEPVFHLPALAPYVTLAIFPPIGVPSQLDLRAFATHRKGIGLWNPPQLLLLNVQNRALGAGITEDWKIPNYAGPVTLSWVSTAANLALSIRELGPQTLTYDYVAQIDAPSMRGRNELRMTGLAAEIEVANLGGVGTTYYLGVLGQPTAV